MVLFCNLAAPVMKKLGMGEANDVGAGDGIGVGDLVGKYWR